AIAVPASGTRTVLLAPLTAAGPTRTGWARLETTAGSLSGAATFQLRDGVILRTTVGVGDQQPIAAATIHVDNDDTQNRFTGFAVANPTTESINIKVVTLNEDGQVLDTVSPGELNPLAPGAHVSRFLNEYLPGRSRLRGSLVLQAQGGKRFSVVALILDQGLLTSVPIAPQKPSNVPD